jgi:hypothetical protein
MMCFIMQVTVAIALGRLKLKRMAVPGGRFPMMAQRWPHCILTVVETL